MGVADVKPSSWVGEDGGEPILGRSERSAEPARRAGALTSGAQGRRIELISGAAPIGRVTPSHAAHATASDESRPTHELFRFADPARRRGVLWHAWLEAVAWSEDGPPSADQLSQRAREAGLGHVEALEVEEFMRALAQPEIQAELSRAEAAKRLAAQAGDLRLLREGRFAYLRDAEAGRELVQGAFDRALISDANRRAEIVDFKTEGLASEDERGLRARAEKYRAQMELYRSALSRREGIDESKIDLRVCFVAAGRTIRLS